MIVYKNGHPEGWDYTDEACLRRLNKKTDLLQPDWVLVKKPGFGVWVGGSKPVFFKRSIKASLIRGWQEFKESETLTLEQMWEKIDAE